MLAWLDKWVVQVQENDERAIWEEASSQSRSISSSKSRSIAMGASRSGMGRWERDGERDAPQRSGSRLLSNEKGLPVNTQPHFKHAHTSCEAHSLLVTGDSGRTPGR